MTKSVDDVHCMDAGYLNAKQRLKNADIGEKNKVLVEDFIIALRREGVAKATITVYISYITQMAQQLQEIGFTETLDKLDPNTFDRLLIFLEDERKLSPGTIRNYKKLIKKFFAWSTNGNQPKWIRDLKLKAIESPVQPSDILTADELSRLLEACRHPRDKAIIAVLADGGIRVGALASCRVKNVEFNQHGAMIYLSKTGANKTTPAKGIPLTWSTGYLNQWLAVHPLHDDPETPLWVTLDKNKEAVSYRTIRKMIITTAEKAGIKKNVHPHLLRHTAITNWILDGLNEQEVKHRAGWSRGSTQMFKVYANFTDQEINNSIFEKYGLKTKDKRHIILRRCPRCNNVLKSDDNFCSQCALVLDQATALKFGKDAERLDLLFLEGVSIDPKISEIVAKLVDIEVKKLLNK
ncbi:MAG: tyrosine-type recombinase/integrase [Methanosarcina barkeri]|nr:tyrosine-type recombinase/integrase [Methanosarcina sp. ERenArc_MAG2]